MIEPYASQILLELAEIGRQVDSQIDLFHTAVLIASLDHPGRSLQRYTHHKKRLVDACHKACGEDNLGADAQLTLLKTILVEQEDYTGDIETYDRLDNADIMSVIDRRKGLPVTLSILYLSVARSLGWEIQALNFPAHVFLRIETQGERLIFDPFEDAKIMEAHDLREKLKMLVGERAELSSHYYTPMSNRDILIRLQNNIKTRLISGEDFTAALQRIDIMRLIVPEEPRLLFEAGVLNARIGQRKKAIKLIYEYIESVESQGEKDEALLLLKELEYGLN